MIFKGSWDINIDGTLKTGISIAITFHKYTVF